MQIYNQRLEHQDLTEAQLAKIEQQRQDKHYLYLDFDTRQRSRFKAQTEDGQDIGIDLPRTETLKDGSVLSSGLSSDSHSSDSDNSHLIEVKAAKQALVAVTADDGFALMKGAYHLGNRHVPLMITPDTLYFEPDHVLEAMLQNLGLTVQAVDAPFEPETGAYKTATAHGHSHDQQSSHAHNHGSSHSSSPPSHNHSPNHDHGHGHAHD